MRIELCWLLSFWGFAAMALVCGLLAWPQLSAAWPSIEERIDRFRRQPPLAKVVVLVFIVGFIAYGSTKTNQVDQTSGTNIVEIVEGGTNEIVRLFGLFDCSIEEVRPSVTPEDIARGWQLWEVKTNCNISYAMPESAAFATNWWVRGAYEDCSIVRLGDCSIGGGVSQSNNLNNPNNQAMSFPFGTNEYDSVWALTWGKLRFALRDGETEIAAVGAPMSAVPHCSRLWSAADTNGSRLVTWENFALNRDTNTPVNAQIELRTTGDFITRSNEVETVYRRVNQEDWDGDGWRNEDDGNPYDWDEGAEWYYGPMNDLPAGCNEDAYYSISVRVAGNHTAWVTFEGDGPSDLPDPCFYAKPNEVYEVLLLIGKAYDVTCDAPIEFTGSSDADVVVNNVSSNGFRVVWPVVISDEPISAPRLLLGASSARGSGDFSLWVSPSWLDGSFYWSTSNCCEIVQNGGPFDFTCGSSNCGCGGCELAGSYAYEGYTVRFSGIECGCHYHPNNATRFWLGMPTVVFKDGELGSMSVNFHHGNDGIPEEGTLTLEVTGENIRIWEDAERSCEVSGSRSWDVSGFSGASLFVEGVKASSSVGDITVRLTWQRPGGSTAETTGRTTCAEVEKVNVESSACGASDNPPPFDGQMPHDFDVTHSLPPDQHAVVFFKDVVNEADFTVNDFTVSMTLQVKPADAPVGRASWFTLEPTPQSGSLVSASALRGELRNPKVGGVYHIGAAFSGSPTNECNIVLPLAGASVDAQIFADFESCNDFVTNVLRFVREREVYLGDPRFGRHLFWNYGSGDYRGRPANSNAKMAWHYNQVNDSNSLGATCTCMGLPIRMAKLSSFVVGYVTECMGVPSWAKKYSQRWGTKNDKTAELSWNIGESVAHGVEFAAALSNCVYTCWRQHEPKADKQWPCLLPAENYIPPSLFIYPNYSYTSPGFLDMEDAEDFDY